MVKPKAAVFASGTGSNFTAIMEADDLRCDVALLVCDVQTAKVIEKAKRLNVQTYVFHPKSFANKSAYETELLHVLREYGIDWVFLAGYMRLIGDVLLEAYSGKIVNIHPSYLPEFPGKDAIGQAYRAGVSETGVTIHFVDEGMDTGPIIKQEKVSIQTDDTIETLAKKIHALEHELY